MENILRENQELKESLSRFTDECEGLTKELKVCESELKVKDIHIARLQGMVEAFEICVKARK